MSSHRLGASNGALVLMLTSVWSCLVAALDVDVCASFNTASSAKNVSIYQSNGLCHDFCISTSAFAVTQANGCWCSDYFPDESTQVDASKCNFPCPGYPLEDCGGIGLFGYIQLNQVMPSGTAAPSSSSSSSSSSSKSSTSSSQSVQSTASSSSSSSNPPTPTSPLKSTTTTTTTTSSEMTATSLSSTSHGTSTSQSTTIQTVTDSDGGIRTVTVIPTIAADRGGARLKASKLSSGAIAGIVIGAILAVLIAAGGIFMLYLRRRRNQDGYENDPSIRGSSSAMMGGGHPDMSIGGESSHSPGSVGNRNSTIQIDPRMDPFKQGLYLRTNSHESLNTLRDEHDYSRRIQHPKVLRATNPDPEDI